MDGYGFIDTSISGLIKEREAVLAEGRLDEYRELSWYLGDHYEEAGMLDAAEGVRRAGETARMPGVLWPTVADLAAKGLSEHQADHLNRALARSIGVLAGTPGTGKTFTAARVIGWCVDTHGLASTSVCAPTGKAAVRITQALAGYGIELRATTIHSLLRITRNGHDGRGWGFAFNRDNPLPFRFVFVDEVSMGDTTLMACLLAACAPGTHVMLIGDPHQLPPVGHGSPLRDLIAAGVPTATLSEIRRNAGQIVKACAAIKDGKPFSLDDVVSSNLHCCGSQFAEGQVATILSYVRMCRQHNQGWQVLCGINKGPLGTKQLNLMLQKELNPGPLPEGNKFRARDRVICLKNGWYPLGTGDGWQEDGDTYVANGEQGTAIETTSRRTVVHFQQPDRNVIIPVRRAKVRNEEEDDSDDDAQAGDFALGYAITCHRAQGSEWPVVIVVLDPSPGARQVCGREWLYTAISRASELCVLAGREGVAQMMVRRPALHRRRTFLAEDIRRKEAKP